MFRGGCGEAKSRVRRHLFTGRLYGDCECGAVSTFGEMHPLFGYHIRAYQYTAGSTHLRAGTQTVTHDAGRLKEAHAGVRCGRGRQDIPLSSVWLGIAVRTSSDSEEQE